MVYRVSSRSKIVDRARIAMCPFSRPSLSSCLCAYAAKKYTLQHMRCSLVASDQSSRRWSCTHVERLVVKGFHASPWLQVSMRSVLVIGGAVHVLVRACCCSPRCLFVRCSLWGKNTAVYTQDDDMRRWLGLTWVFQRQGKSGEQG